MSKRPKCSECGQPLVAIGSWRKNGADHKDWADRTLHKKCFKAATSYKYNHRWKVLTFGKYKGLNVQEVGMEDEGYLRWMLRATNLYFYFPDIHLYFDMYKS